MAWPFTPQQRGRFRSGSPFLQGPVEPGKSFDGAELLRNVQRMLTDNDRLKKELNDKVARIEAQNERISELIAKNERLVDERNSMLERRNEALRNTTEQSSEVLQRIQAQKAALETEITNVQSELSTAQRHLTILRQTEQVRRNDEALFALVAVALKRVAARAPPPEPAPHLARGRN